MSNKPELLHKEARGKFTFEIYRVAKTKNLDKGAYFYKFKVFQEFPTKDKTGRDVVGKDFAIAGFQIKEYVEVLEYADNYARTLASGSSASAVSQAAARVAGNTSEKPKFNF